MDRISEIQSLTSNLYTVDFVSVEFIKELITLEKPSLEDLRDQIEVILSPYRQVLESFQIIDDFFENDDHNGWSHINNLRFCKTGVCEEIKEKIRKCSREFVGVDVWGEEDTFQKTVFMKEGSSQESVL